ncbi:MAG: M20 family peptidase [Acetobacteraceae bacterium]|nr:M20 family peptidase [Acetobacteraceae bacterium]
MTDSRDLLAELASWVRIETPTTDALAVNRLMDVAQRELAQVGADLTRVPGRDGFGDSLIARTPGLSAGDRPILVAGHLDTVWPHGTLAKMPFEVNGEKAHGPGIYDMKAGSFLAFHAVRAILRDRIPTRHPIVLLLTPDEEVGSPSSRWLIEQEAANAAAVLIPEPASATGACVTSRKGIGRFTLLVEGKASHAGTAFQDGASATVELAHQILALHRMVEPDDGITVNTAPVWGGTRPNVVAAAAGCEIDLRVNSARDGELMTARILGLQSRVAGCTVSVKGGMNRPPYAETKEIRALYEKAWVLADRIGLKLPRQHRSGGSDGNFTAALGIPTLDGLGCPGAGAHAVHEHILWRQLAPRAALMASLLETLDEV